MLLPTSDPSRMYSSVVVKTAPPGFNFPTKSFAAGRLPWART